MPWNPLHWMFPRVGTPARPQRIGLALSGGAVRGAAHIGVLDVLEREGIRPDLVAGVSAGSVVGALYCAGYSPARLQELASGMQWSRLARIGRPRLSLFDTTRMEKYLNELLEGKTFEQLDMQFVAVAVDIVTSTEVVLNEGPVARALRASCAIPGLFTPIERGEQLLVDGGVMNNLPVQVLRERGADYVIAVDVMWSMGNNRRPNNIFDLSLLSAYAALRGAYRESNDANCLIRPQIPDLSLTDFADVGALVARGRQAAEAALDQLRGDLGLPHTAE
jgi:NTE family protein